MTIVIALLLSIVTLFFLAYPWLRPRPGASRPKVNSRPRSAKMLEVDIEKDIKRLRQSKKVITGVCPKCGAKYPEGGRFCSQCGTKI